MLADFFPNRFPYINFLTYIACITHLAEFFTQSFK